MTHAMEFITIIAVTIVASAVANALTTPAARKENAE